MLFVANKQLNFYPFNTMFMTVSVFLWDSIINWVIYIIPEVLQKGFVEEAGIVLNVIFSEHRLATHFLSPNAYWER